MTVKKNKKLFYFPFPEKACDFSFQINMAGECLSEKAGSFFSESQ